MVSRTMVSGTRLGCHFVQVDFVQDDFVQNNFAQDDFVQDDGQVYLRVYMQVDRSFGLSIAYAP